MLTDFLLIWRRRCARTTWSTTRRSCTANFRKSSRCVLLAGRQSLRDLLISLDYCSDWQARVKSVQADTQMATPCVILTLLFSLLRWLFRCVCSELSEAERTFHKDVVAFAEDARVKDGKLVEVRALLALVAAFACLRGSTHGCCVRMCLTWVEHCALQLEKKADAVVKLRDAVDKCVRSPHMLGVHWLAHPCSVFRLVRVCAEGSN